MPQTYYSATKLADAIIQSVGKKIVLGLPMGLGKAVHVANALFQKARADSSIELTIFTALTLDVPASNGELEHRYLDPLYQRLLPGWPSPDYARALRRGDLPDNVQVREFYFGAASLLDNVIAQQSYTSLNYSQVPSELLAMGVNVVAQLVGTRPESPGRFSMGSNPEITLDLLPELDLRRRSGQPVAIVGQISRSMPYMTGVAELEAGRFDFLLEGADYEYPLFGIPNRRVTRSNYATGMHIASLVPDGGTLQVGIGSLSDAVAHCIKLRHEHPDIYRHVLEQLPGGLGSPRRPNLVAALEPFRQGLYVSTELLSDAVFSLYEAGIVRRPADENSDVCIHAGFFIGSNRFYEALRQLPDNKRREIAMTSISFVNTLYGDELTKRRQRRSGCFINQAMMVTLLGAAVSDGLDDGRVVSGVGGQFDFIRMAHDLEDAHSVVMIESQRVSNGVASSNIRWNYGHNTVPRHYRDIFATEYGLAATRGQPDSKIVSELLNIANSAFQDELLAKAKRAGKIAKGYTIPESARNNHGQVLQKVFADPDIASYFPEYPLGTDLTPVEQQLAKALVELKDAMASDKWRTFARALLHSPDRHNRLALERMKLDKPKNLRQRLYRKLVALALDH